MRQWPAALLLLLFISPGQAQAELPGPVLQILSQYKLAADGLSVFVQAVDDSKPLLSFNPDVPRSPASTIKVVTTYVGLQQLKPNYTWKTEAYLDGPLSGDRLQGDLILKGYGDPLLTVEAWWKFLQGLRRKGLRHIDGDLIVDDRYFAPLDLDPDAFDGHGDKPYNATPNALLLNFQAIEFYFYPEPKQNRVRVETLPSMANLHIVNRLKLGKGRCNKRRIRMDASSGADAATVTLSGLYPRACGPFSMHRVVLKPQAMVYGAFQALWREIGGTLKGDLRLGAAPEKKPFHVMRSRPLGELIHGMNKYSNNVMTRHLLLTLGAVRFKPPGSLGKGRVAVREWLESNDLSFSELSIDNGAGLSRSARISARSLGRLLLHAYHSPYMPELVASLAVSGIDGTLRRRFRGEALAGRLHLKTGTIDHVKGAAGYLLSRSGRMFVVVSLHNHPNVHRGSGTLVQNALLRWLYEQ